jgi:hypothetical protein
MTDPTQTDTGKLDACKYCGYHAEVIASKSPAGGYIIRCMNFDCQAIRSGSTRTAAIRRWNACPESARQQPQGVDMLAGAKAIAPFVSAPLGTAPIIAAHAAEACARAWGLIPTPPERPLYRPLSELPQDKYPPNASPELKKLIDMEKGGER